MLIRVALAILIGVVVGLSAGVLYYWRAAEPFRAEARRLAAESDQDLAAMAKTKEWNDAIYRQMREKIALRERQYAQALTIRQRARRNGRIVATVVGISTFIGSLVVSGRVMKRRKPAA